MKNKDEGEGKGKLNKEGGGGGLVGGLKRRYTVCDFPEPAHHYYLVT